MHRHNSSTCTTPRACLQSTLWTTLALAAFLSPSVTHAQNARRSGEVIVEGNRLIRDGQPWIPHGYVQIAFVAPPGMEDSNPNFGVARRNYSPDEYLEMRAVGADSVRIQVSQPGLEPGSGHFSRRFFERVIGAVQAARAAGLTVILSIQDESQSGETHPATLPNDGTRLVWTELAPLFGQDRGILFELFNEPELPVSQQNWLAWAEAMNETIDTIRRFGATNVVVADGLDYAEQLEGAPHLSDALGQIAYASHPYAHYGSMENSTTWDQKFGHFALTAPVIVTEWTAGAYDCDDLTATSTAPFLRYLQDHHVGLEAVTWDWSGALFGSAIYDFPFSRLSSFTGLSGRLSCNESGFGPGSMIEFWYVTGVPPSSVF